MQSRRGNVFLLWVPLLVVPVQTVFAQARIVSLTGAIVAKRGAQSAQTLRINDPVEIGDELSTGENSEAIIQTSDGSTVRIFPDSRVIFSEQSHDIGTLLHLFLGSIKVHIEKLSGRPNAHKMTTPTAVIAVRGTTFSVFVDEEEATLVAVDEGVVGVANINWPSEETILRPGQRSWVGRGVRPLQAQAFRGPSERADLAPGRGRRNALVATGPPATVPPGRAVGRPPGVPPANPPLGAPGLVGPPGLSRRPGPPR